MKKWFVGINLYYKVALISIINIVFISLILFFIFIKSIIIPLSFLFGGFFGSLFYFLYGLVERKDNVKTKNSLIVFITFSRLIILIILFLIEAILFKFYDFKFFEPISLVLGYFLPIIILVIINFKLGRSKKKCV